MQDEFERGIGMVEENEDDENPPISPTLCQRQIRITRKRIFAKENLKLQAKKMTKLSDKKYPSAAVRDFVKVRVPDNDRSRCDARKILGVQQLLMKMVHTKLALNSQQLIPVTAETSFQYVMSLLLVLRMCQMKMYPFEVVLESPL